MPYRRAPLLAASVCVLLFAVYGGVGHNPLHYDDFHSIRDNPHLTFAEGVAGFFYDAGAGGESGFARAASRFSVDAERAMYRPLLLVSYATNSWVGMSYHWGNLIIHGLNCLVLAAVLGALGLAAAPLAGGVLLFALHPLQAEAVNYASARSESLMALFFLLALWGHVAGCNKGEKRYFVGALAALSAALMVKAVAATFVGVALLYSWRRAAWRGWGWGLAYGGVVLGYVWAVRQAAGKALGEPVRGYGAQAMTQLKAGAYYLYLSVFPARLSVEHGFVEGEAGQAAVWLALLLLCCLGYGLWHWGRTVGGQLASWAVVVLLPTAVVPLNVLVNEHRLYLSVAFAAPLVAAALWTMPFKRYRWLCGLVGLGALGLMAQQRSVVWRDGESLWADAAAKAPAMYRARMHLGEVLQEKGRLPEAVVHFEAAARAAPHLAETHYNLGNALVAAGHVGEAVDAYGRALRADAFFAPARLNLASALVAAGEWGRAEAVLDSAARLAGDSAGAAEVEARLAALYKKQGRGAEAEKALLRALDHEPGHRGARFNLANLYFDAGRLADATVQYRATLEADSAYGPAYINLGDAFLSLRRFDEALKVYETGLRATAMRAIFFYGAGRAHEGSGRRQAAKDQYLACMGAPDATPRLQAAAQRRLAALDERSGR